MKPNADVAMKDQSNKLSSIWCQCPDRGLRIGDWIGVYWLPEVKIGRGNTNLFICSRCHKLEEEYCKEFCVQRCLSCLGEFVTFYEELCIRCFKQEHSDREYLGVRWVNRSYDRRMELWPVYRPNEAALFRRKCLTR